MAKGATIMEGGYGAKLYAPTRTLTRTNPPEPDRTLEEIVREAQQSQRRRRSSPSAPTRLDSRRKRLEPRSPRRNRCKYGVEPEYEGMWNGFRVLKALDGGKAFLIEGWPTPILAGARTDLPPDPGKPTYGPAAREEARKLLREAKRAKVNLGPITKANLVKVIHGEEPLSYSLWDGTQAYVRRVSTVRERERDLRENPMAVDFRGLLGHEGSGLVWREHRGRFGLL